MLCTTMLHITNAPLQNHTTSRSMLYQINSPYVVIPEVTVQEFISKAKN